MDERDRERQAIDARPEGSGRLRAGVDMAQAGVERLRGGGDRLRGAGEDAAWLLRERIVWPAQDGLEALGPRGRIGVFGGGGIAVAGVVAALLIAGGGSGSAAGTTEAFVVPERAPTPAAVVPAPKPQKQKPAQPTGPTLHGAPPDFSPAQDVRSGVGDGKAVGAEAAKGGTGGVSAQRGARKGNDDKATASSAAAGAGDAPASTAKIGSTPAATASAEAQAESLADDDASGAARNGASRGRGTAAGKAGAEGGSALSGPPAPKAAKRVARHFAEAFVVYETGGIDAKVRKGFRHTSTRQLSDALLHRPPRQPAAVKVPQAKVVTVVAGPSKGSVYEVSVSLLRVGVTSELRLAMERGPGKKWQVTNVLG
ncbi:MAG TPA: hypothetical protein VMF55_15465 [Solirubrobacterales bacterium]|nr:hypothetical protein [Solirubrobacterales bacterium]